MISTKKERHKLFDWLYRKKSCGDSSRPLPREVWSLCPLPAELPWRTLGKLGCHEAGCGASYGTLRGERHSDLSPQFVQDQVPSIDRSIGEEPDSHGQHPPVSGRRIEGIIKLQVLLTGSTFTASSSFHFSRRCFPSVHRVDCIPFLFQQQAIRPTTDRPPSSQSKGARQQPPSFTKITLRTTTALLTNTQLDNLPVSTYPLLQELALGAFLDYSDSSSTPCIAAATRFTNRLGSCINHPYRPPTGNVPCRDAVTPPWWAS